MKSCQFHFALSGSGTRGSCPCFTNIYLHDDSTFIEEKDVFSLISIPIISSLSWLLKEWNFSTPANKTVVSLNVFFLNHSACNQLQNIIEIYVDIHLKKMALSCCTVETIMDNPVITYSINWELLTRARDWYFQDYLRYPRYTDMFCGVCELLQLLHAITHQMLLLFLSLVRFDFPCYHAVTLMNNTA